MSDSNLFSRSRKSELFKMAAKVAIKQSEKFFSSDQSRNLKTMIEQADIIVNHVGHLKGAAMKAIQTLSIEGYDFLPPEVVYRLEKLQSSAPPISNNMMMEVMRLELGEERFSKLNNISENPIASASIGQVYRAQYGEQSVAVKVQYPGIVDSIDEDIDVLKKLIKGFLVLSQKKIDIEDLMEEARRVLKLEANYLNELASLIRYKENLKNKPYRIPVPIIELSTQRVLTMSFERGLEFSHWLRTNPKQHQKDEIADALLQLYIIEFFENRFVQTDPNPANFLIDERQQLILLDFGASLEFESNFAEQYQNLLRTAFTHNHKAIRDKVLELGFLSSQESLETQNYFVDFLIYSLYPFDSSIQPFNFSDSSYSVEVRKRALQLTRSLKHSAPPKQLIFLHRKLGGIFMLLKQLGTKKNLELFKQLMIEKDYT